MAYKTIEEIQADINKKHGVDVLISGKELLERPVPRLSTGILSYDLAFGGGWAANQWNELIGIESSGKTALVYKTIAHNQQIDPNFVAMFVAAEGFVPEHAISIGVDLDRIWLVESNEMEVVFDLAVKAVENRTVDLLAIDSLPALVTDAEAEKDLEKGLIVSPSARIISTFFKKYARASRRSLVEEDRPITSIMVNQWRDQIGVMFGDPRITPGGKAKNYQFFLRVDISRDEWLQEGSDLSTRIGQTIACRTIKNKTYPANRRAQVDFYMADSSDGVHTQGEFDTVKDTVNVALALDLFESPRYSFGGVRLATKKDDLPAALREHPEIQEELRKLALAGIYGERLGDND